MSQETILVVDDDREIVGAIAAALEADFVDYWNTFVSGSMVLPKVTVLQSDRFAGMDRAVFLVYPDYNNTHTVAYSVTGDTVRRLGAFPSGLEFAFSAEKGGLLRTTWTQESPGGGAERFYYYYRPLPEGGVEWTEVLKAWADSEGVIQSAAGWQTEDQSLTKPLTPAEFEARLAAADEDFREAETISFGTVKNLAESGFDLSAPLGEESQPGSWRDFLARAMSSSGSQAAAPPPALEGVSRQEADFLTPEQWALFDKAEIYGGYFAFDPGRFAGEDTLNRAQAAVIWSRLDTLFNGPREEPKDPDEGVEEKEMPAFGLQGDETVREMMKRVNAKTPLCEEGRLPNGKSRTEENIQELLELVKQGCPDGTVWSDTIRYDYTVPRLGPTRGCRSFGLAVSDFVFGEDAPITQHRDLRSLSVGDVIHIQFEEVERVLILTGVDREEGAHTACELEKNGKVDWDQWGPLSGLVDATGFTMVYSRWRNA